ncbi:hypothetical protein H0H93_007612 [Arthromyces matolae]|nr:hypothetical protein H0H93_007612 [Arthromyces matolae]
MFSGIENFVRKTISGSIASPARKPSNRIKVIEGRTVAPADDVHPYANKDARYADPSEPHQSLDSYTSLPLPVECWKAPAAPSILSKDSTIDTDTDSAGDPVAWHPGWDMQIEISRLKKDVQRQAAALDSFQIEGHVLRDKLGKEREKVRELQKKRRDLEEENMGHLDTIRDTRYRLESARKVIDECVSVKQRLKEDLANALQQIQEKDRLLRETREQLDKRTVELQGANFFMDQTDAVSGAEIVTLAAALNTEISQSSSLLADSMGSGEFLREELKNDVVLNVEEVIGGDLLKGLIEQRTQKYGDIDPTLLQLALQIALVNYSEQMLSSWTLTDEEENLPSIYESLWKEEKQSVAGRWRSITLAHASSGTGPVYHQKRAVRIIEDILRVAGYNPQPAMGRFYEILREINNRAIRLRFTIGRFISLDIKPYVFHSGSAFDPTIMDDMYDNNRMSISMHPKAGKLVAGTTELGLFSQVKDSTGEVQKTIMLKPKIIAGAAYSAFFPTQYVVHIVIGLVTVLVLRAFSQGKRTNRERVWEAYEEALKAWELANPVEDEVKEAAPDNDRDHKLESEVLA